MHTRTTITYALAVLIVLILGAFTGWYFFLKTQSQTIVQESAARGFTTSSEKAGNGPSAQNVTAPANSSAGNGFFSKLLSTITGGGTGVSEPITTSLTSDISGFPNSNTNGPEQTKAATSSSPATPRPAQLVHVHAAPVAGLAFVKIDGNERLRYVERSSGYVFEVNVESGTGARLTNTLVPKIYEAFFTHDGHIVERSMNDAGSIVTTLGSISSSTQSATSSAQFSSTVLAQNIQRIVSDPKTGALFSLVRDSSGISGIRSEWNGAKPKSVFASAILHWQPEWLSDGRIILTQAASDDVLGYAYEMKSDGTLNPLLRAVPGLTTLPKAGGALLYGQSSGGALTLFIQEKPGATPIRLQIKTIADKCVWIEGKELIAYCAVPQGATSRHFLDDWYRGATHSVDALWRINASIGSAEIVYTPESGTSLDMENLTINAAGTHIAFMNAADKSLWLLRLAE